MYDQSFFLIYKYKYDQEVFSNLLQKIKDPKRKSIEN